jgi:hypothetical protein
LELHGATSPTCEGGVLASQVIRGNTTMQNMTASSASTGPEVIDRDPTKTMRAMEDAIDKLDLAAFVSCLETLEKQHSASFVGPSSIGDVTYRVTILSLKELKVPCGSNMFEYLAKKRAEVTADVEKRAEAIEARGNERSRGTVQLAQIDALGIEMALPKLDVWGEREKIRSGFDAIECLDKMYALLVKTQSDRS